MNESTAATPGFAFAFAPLLISTDMSKVSSRRQTPLSERNQHAHDPAQAQALQRALLAWYAKERRDLPWRRTRDPYAVWLSEIMLQQTRVETVIPYYERFLEAFPSVRELAEAPLDGVLAMWSGLGYYRRARMLHAAAQQVSASGGGFPDTVTGLRGIAGIGAYTAGAIASIAFERRAAVVDGNVARVLARVFAIEEDIRGGAGLARIWSIADGLVSDRDPGGWNQALMELGAMVCVPREPRCPMCPVREQCASLARGLTSELPRLSPKKKPLAIRRVALVAYDAVGAVLLARRRAAGTFGGMWEPPSADIPLHAGTAAEEVVAASARFASLLGVAVRNLEHVGAVVHVLSHRRMHVDVFVGKVARKLRRPHSPNESADYDAIEWVSDLKTRGVTTLARKILAASVTSALDAPTSPGSRPARE